jgi:cytochrome d ubiquinol oxidase subunit I
MFADFTITYPLSSFRSSPWASRCSSSSSRPTRSPSRIEFRRRPLSLPATMAARFWAKIFAINFLSASSPASPWSSSSAPTGRVLPPHRRRHRPAARHGRRLLLLPRIRLPRPLPLRRKAPLPLGAHWLSAFLVFVGSWISGFFIIVTDAWMQHPVAYRLNCPTASTKSPASGAADESLGLAQYAHNMCGAVVTACLRHGLRRRALSPRSRRDDYGASSSSSASSPASSPASCRSSPPATSTASTWRKTSPPPSPAWRASSTARKARPSSSWASPLEGQKIDNPIVVNKVLSFLIYGTTAAEVKGLDQIPRDQWPSTLPLLFYSYHIMAGLGTYFAALMAIAGFLLWRGKLYTARWLLWPSCSASRCPTSPTPPVG